MEQNQGIESAFNDAAMKMRRLHNIQDSLNILRNDPLAINQENGKVNYENMFSLINSLMLEIHSKCSANEKENLEKFKLVIEGMIEHIPIMKTNPSNYKKKQIFDDGRWNKLWEALFKYEKYVRELVDLHKFGAPNANDASKAVLNF